MADALTHRCPNCGGPLLFDPKDQKFHCEYCKSIFTEQEVTDFEAKQNEAHVNVEPTVEETEKVETPAMEQETEIGLFICPSCGAQIVTDTTTAATYCYYCHNPVVLSERLSGKFLPEKVLPFAIEKEEAIQKFLKWTKKKKFIPKDFFSQKQIENLTGTYFPYWLVDSELQGDLEANATNIRVWRVGETEYTETKQYHVKRGGKLSFKDLLKNALSKNVQQKMVIGVQPFDLTKAVDFKSQYLSGFQAEKRDIEFQAIEKDVNNELKNYSQELLRNTVNGYATVTNVRSNVQEVQTTKNYVLLPLWILTYRQAGSKTVYYYAMNGQSGKVSGVLPISMKKLVLTGISIFAVLLILFLIGGYFL
ncbi:MAG: TFIIB-type zinc ribbon-containing protein [Lactobacillales bacterium]|jgi:DNA-directed RNA polymerase subunit M/transcription elongation factor TFIIS/uncharacterized membrane protein|nr:TFIIB-type zinc ribbon-containing protein [Lactobacillales bacterium]